MTPTAVTPASIEQAADLLHRGKLVAIPTETVYGLGADASNPEAVAKIFQAKGRPADHPLIVHLAYASQMKDWAEEVPDSALRLASAFWPGPLTMILRKKTSVPAVVTGGQETVALRVPDNPVALWLLRVFGGGIAAPSANRFGRISPTTAQHVAEELGDAVDCILDGGPCTVGVESTIIDLTDQQPTILRPGRITRSQLEEVLQREVALKSQHKIRAPGMLASHYAPHTPAYLCATATLLELLEEKSEQGKQVGVLVFSESLNLACQHLLRLPQVAEDYEAALYGALRQLDKLGLDSILVEQPPETEEWMAVNDRLGKATI
ncbi:L-threonylcarbamoyladenylate synthase [Methylomonas rapida]|uniref:Threonylcarbamoyl-AMP synthase n=1 Tax=Methylomonas rapida TaxID=2963939 RepID=A0ABY7GKX6_9GAMM|nr:L-threonylcarbamoyladenylate synthase [Methylomonas rapida]WAR45161.1 L-threonylcarbamoyladenylate synthase [Methylomonas rapida]